MKSPQQADGEQPCAYPISLPQTWEAFAKERRVAQGMNSKELRDHARQILETTARLRYAAD